MNGKDQMTEEKRLIEPELRCRECGCHRLIINTSEPEGPAQAEFMFFTCTGCGFHGDWGHFEWTYEKERP